mgnify:CR=1 FL=1|tara:strand:- start:194 stop:1144 length:951 start_codon:yes stop_codon:yes gene_type:complete
MFFIGNECIKELNEMTKLDDKTSSSYWDHYHSDFHFDGQNFSGIKMLGDSHYNSSTIKKLSNKLVDKLLLPTYYKYASNKQRFNELNRISNKISKMTNYRHNISSVRHSLTLDFLLESLGPKLKKNSNICVIGDGYANMSSLLIASKSASKVFLINLTKSLLLDLVSLKKAFPSSKFLDSICLVSDKKSLIESFDVKYKIVAISSMNYELLQYCPIDLVININSMQEINKDITKKYFDYMRVIASKRTLFFYCCNRELKKLNDGAIIDFFKYPWKDSDEIIVDELCPWQKKYYSIKPPFFHNYDGPVRHRLVRLSK